MFDEQEEVDESDEGIPSENEDEEHISEYLLDYTESIDKSLATLKNKKSDKEEEKQAPKQSVEQKDRKGSLEELSEKPVEPNKDFLD